MYARLPGPNTFIMVHLENAWPKCGSTVPLNKFPCQETSRPGYSSHNLTKKKLTHGLESQLVGWSLKVDTQSKVESIRGLTHGECCCHVKDVRCKDHRASHSTCVSVQEQAWLHVHAVVHMGGDAVAAGCIHAILGSLHCWLFWFCAQEGHNCPDDKVTLCLGALLRFLVAQTV